jgi:hypothetical protein
MLLSLPTELIQRIVRLATPDEITSSTYQHRQDTLRSLCLVNQLLRELAQPVLEEAMVVRKATTWRSRGGPSGERAAGKLRFLWVQEDATIEWEFDLPSLEPLLATVTTLRLSSVKEVRVGTLAALSREPSCLSWRGPERTDLFLPD